VSAREEREGEARQPTQNIINIPRYGGGKRSILSGRKGGREGEVFLPGEGKREWPYEGGRIRLISHSVSKRKRVGNERSDSISSSVPRKEFSIYRYS